MYVLIPAYEPKEKFIDLVRNIKEKTNYKILVIDDGSSLQYQRIFYELEKYATKVIHHDRNFGKGAALKTGFSYILAENLKENVVCADCDGQHTVEDIIKVAKKIDNEKNQIILGVRKFNNNVPFKSKFGNNLTSAILSMITGKYISDTQTGLRGYTFSILNWLCKVDGDRFEYELNILLKARENKIGIKEVTISTIYENNNSGTHFRPIIDSIRVYLPILKFSGSSVLSGILDFVLLLLINKATNDLFISVVISRIISSIFNYTINKNIVFKYNQKNYISSIIKYFSLVIFILVFNYSILHILTKVLIIPIAIAKVITEFILFTISYKLQKKIIFK